MPVSREDAALALTVLLTVGLVAAGSVLVHSYASLVVLGVLLIVVGVLCCCCGLPALALECVLALFSMNNTPKRYAKIQRLLQANWIVPLVYREEYNITAFGLEKMHPFDSTKYGNITRYLLQESDLQLSTFHSPSAVSSRELLSVHSLWYLLKLHSTIYLTSVLEVPVVTPLPSYIVHKCVLLPMRYQTGGSIDAAYIALERGYCINLGGGFHHACASQGGGFCVYADITIAIRLLRKYHVDRVQKVMIVDLDAHQGNGHERDFFNDPLTHIVDLFNPNIYPNDRFAAQAIATPLATPSFSSRDDNYMATLKRGLTGALNSFQPDFIFYNAGDPLGSMQLSAEGVIKRDVFVFKQAMRRNIPVVMVLSGGYQTHTARVVADSILYMKERMSLFSLQPSSHSSPNERRRMREESKESSEASALDSSIISSD